MAFHLQLMHADDTPLETGTFIALLGDGQVLARATVGAAGGVTFDADTSSAKVVAIRHEVPES